MRCTTMTLHRWLWVTFVCPMKWKRRTLSYWARLTKSLRTSMSSILRKPRGKATSQGTVPSGPIQKGGLMKYSRMQENLSAKSQSFWQNHKNNKQKKIKNKKRRVYFLFLLIAIARLAPRSAIPAPIVVNSGTSTGGSSCSNLHTEEQPSLSFVFPSSHCSFCSKTSLPQTVGSNS